MTPWERGRAAAIAARRLAVVELTVLVAELERRGDPYDEPRLVQGHALIESYRAAEAAELEDDDELPVAA